MTNSRFMLYLLQSYRDAWDDYNRAIKKPGFLCWDYVILTASNEQQAECFRMQIKERLEAGMLPIHTHFAVVADEDGVRVGSGGATLSVIRYIASQTGQNDFSGLRILVIHSGGDSKRVPQYSALGKLFSPVPHELPNGKASTLFDEFMISMASLPGRIKEGMVLLSGDVLLLFNPLQVDFSGNGAVAVSFKEDVNVGKDHGVFLRGEDGNVKAFLHKQSVEMLKKAGAVNEAGTVDIDTGVVIFSTDMLAALYKLISTDEDYSKYVNSTVRLSLYGDFLYPLATDSTLEQFYNEKAEGILCPELINVRTEVWNTLRPYRMKLLRLAPAKFIHFGTTHEILELMNTGIKYYRDLGWDHQVNSSMSNRTAGYCSVLSEKAQIGKGCYLEVSYVHSNAIIGDNTVLSYIDIHDETIPSSVVLHGLKQRDGRFVARIYGVDDNPKDELKNNCSFLGTTLESFMKKNNISEDELWDEEIHSLWNAKIYPACSSIREAVAAALNVYELAHGRGNIDSWRSAQKKSLSLGFNEADPHALNAWDKRMRELVCMDRLAALITSGRPVTEAAGIGIGRELTPIQIEWLEKHLLEADYSKAMRLYYYLGMAIGGSKGEELIEQCFRTIRNAILGDALGKFQHNKNCRIAEEEYCVHLPLRVNWGGGWSDTPPYCNENGGTVLNAAIALNGKLPVQVTIRRLDEHKIVFDSRDMDIHGEFTKIEQLQTTGDPYDPFALQKAALLACGIIPSEGNQLEHVLMRMGGGFHMQTEVVGVPKGSGLGTSSILAAACAKALFGFFGIEHTDDDLCRHVLYMEQIMSTGGGWQDQIGGLSKGIKYITSRLGLTQQIKIQHVQLSKEVYSELNERFALIYTGQRRLARNLLRDVVGHYVGNSCDSLFALNEIQRIAALMRFELERGRVDAFAELLNRHWELSQMIDSGSTNTLIDQIFDSISDLISGRMICGAGGGGFLQVILNKGVSKNEVHERLKDIFQDSDIDVWDCTLI